MKKNLSIMFLFGIISSIAIAQTDSVTDIDGNTYSIIRIRNQIWMAENLKTTRFNDGTVIPLVENSNEWRLTSQPAYCWYNNDEKTNKNLYGALYNWFAVNGK